MNNFRNFRDSGRRDGRRTNNSSSNNNSGSRTSTRQIDDLAPKCVRSSFTSRFTRSLRRRIPSTPSTSSSSGSDAGVFANARHARSEENDENVNIHGSPSPISADSSPVRPRRRSVAIDRRPTSTSARHPYSYRRSEYLDANSVAVSELQSLFAPDANLVPALSPRDTGISFENSDDQFRHRHNPAEVLADLLQVELDNHRKRSSTASSLYVMNNPRLGPDHSKRVAAEDGEDREISFFDYDYFFNESPSKKQKTAYDDFVVQDDDDELDTILWPPASKPTEQFQGPVSTTRAGRDIGFRMAYTLSDDGHDTLGDPRTSWFSDSSYSGSDTDSQDSTDTSSSGSQLSIIRAASLASLREFN